MILNDIESQLAYVADKMKSEKCSNIQHIVELTTGEKVKFYIRRLILEIQELNSQYNDTLTAEQKDRMIEHFRQLVARLYPATRKNLFEV